MAANPPATTYWWFPQAPLRPLTVVARTAGDPLALAAAIGAQVREIDPNQPIAETRTMPDIVSADLAQPRSTMVLLGGFAALALFLSAIGLYGVIAFDVTERTQEMGLRAALGAQHRDLLRLVMQRGLLLTGAGLAIGLAGVLALGRTISSLTYGVTPVDPVTLLAVVLFLSAVAMLAAYIPARRTARIDPMVAMRTG
jgi:putative ABC transport system permease protein